MPCVSSERDNYCSIQVWSLLDSTTFELSQKLGVDTSVAQRLLHHLAWQPQIVMLRFESFYLPRPPYLGLLRNVLFALRMKEDRLQLFIDAQIQSKTVDGSLGIVSNSSFSQVRLAYSFRLRLS